MGSAIKRVEEVPSASPDRAGRAGIDIEWRNGMRTRILETGEIIPDIRDVERGRPEVDPRSQVIRAAYTPERAGRGTLGEGQGIPAGAVIRLAEGKWSLTDANAELLHDAWARLLRGSERRLLTDRYARELEGRLRAAGKEVTPEALEEEAVHKWAEEVTKWQERAIAEGAVPKASPGWFKRLWEWVTRMASALRAPEFERLTREAAEGGLWQRGGSERAAGALGDTYREGGIAGVARAGARFASDRLYGQQNKLGLYSQLDKALEKAPSTASGQDWARFLLGKGVKKEELRWTGVDDLLQQKGKERVSKREIEEWVREHDVGVEEVTRGGRPKPLWKADPEIGADAYTWTLPGAAKPRYAVHLLRSGKWWAGETNGREVGIFPSERAAKYAIEDFHGTEVGQATKFAQYQLPGGSGYREVLLTLPQKPLTGRAKELFDQQEWGMLRDMQERGEIPGEMFVGPHWSEPNVLAHLRLNDRVDADGKRVLFVEEVQSDWAQKGRREGFDNGVSPESLLTEENGKFGVRHSNGGWITPPMYPTAEAALANARINMHTGRNSALPPVPEAPYVTSTEDWSALAMKRVLRMAAEEGYDRVAWTPGEVQAARYDLSKQVDKLEWDPQRKLLRAFKGDSSEPVIERDVDPKDLAEVIGKEAAEKIQQQPLRETEYSHGVQTLQGQQLSIGGEGMHGYYDKILPGVVSKLGKKFGAKVGSTSIEAGDQALRAPSIDITPEMRKSVMEEGFARFAASPRAGAAENAPKGSRFAAGPRDIPPFTEADKAVADAEAAREKARVAARELRTPPIRAAEREAARAGREVKKAEKGEES
jgi:hypothetical protein